METLLSRIEGRRSLLNSHASSTPKLLYSANCIAIVVFPVAQAGTLPDIKIVNLDWLLDSVNGGKLLDEAQYLFTSRSIDKSVTKSQSNSGKKRARADTPDNHDAGNAASPDIEENQQPPVKRQKDGQKAKSGSALNVPVDEGCNLAWKDALHSPSQKSSKLTG